MRGVRITVAPGEIVGIVGESGSGKTLTAMAIADLLPAGRRRRPSDSALRRGPRARWATRSDGALLGRSLAVVYQDPMASLNPALRVGRQLGEVAEVHEGLSKPRGAASAASSVCVRSESDRPRGVCASYPHELSGGMRQRAMIAMGLMGEPEADHRRRADDRPRRHRAAADPELLRDVGASTGAAAILISHDVAVVSQLCSRVLVMYAGRIVEELDVATLVRGPAHPYTAALVASVPTMESDRSAAAREHPRPRSRPVRRRRPVARSRHAARARRNAAARARC